MAFCPHSLQAQEFRVSIPEGQGPGQGKPGRKDHARGHASLAALTQKNGHRRGACVEGPKKELTFYSHGCRVPTAMKPKGARYQNRIELLQGTLDMLILQTLQWGPQHGYAISQSIRGRSGEVLRVETGSLYPALHRLEKQGWVASGWKPTDAGQRAKFYRLTASGKRQLTRELDRWSQLTAAIAGALNPLSKEGAQ